jgi:hypothetical protein
MKTDEVIDAFVLRQNALGRSFARISEAPWFSSSEAQLPCRLPPSFRSLFSRYRFGPFRISGVEFFGNLGGNSRDELAVASLKDRTLSRVCQQHALIQVGRPDTGQYDPVCFDMSRRNKDGEAPLVCLDHEAILMEQKIRLLREYAKSFEEAILEKRTA